MKQIVNARIVTAEGILEGKTLVFSDKIEAIEDTPRAGIETVDAKGNLVIPGLIELHMHGYYGRECTDDDDSLDAIAREIFKNGVTAFLPTMHTSPYEVFDMSFNRARDLQKRQKSTKLGISSAEVLGVHAEGPFLCMEKKGAQNPDYIVPPDFDFIKKNADLIKIITIAPEMDKDFETIKRIVSETGIVVSAGHTSADYDTMVKAIEAGVSHATHLFNAMSSFSHRAPGGTGALLFSDKVSCELICDGVHVNKAWFEPVYRLKGKNLNLITDAVRPAGLPDGKYDSGGLTVTLEGPLCHLDNGTIAGSVLKLNEAVRNLHKMGVPLHEAVMCASLNNARTLGIDNERGEIKVGLYADLSICTPDMEIISVFKNGQLGYEAK